MIKSSIDPNVVAIDCAAPFFFFDVELPSGRKYTKCAAERIVEAIEADDIEIRHADTEEVVGACVGANIVESGVVGRMILLPEHRDLEPKWNMTSSSFSVALKLKDGVEVSDNVEGDNIENIPYLVVFL